MSKLVESINALHITLALGTKPLMSNLLFIDKTLLLSPVP